MATHSSILAWRVHGQRSLAGYSPWGRKESESTEQLTLGLSEFVFRGFPGPRFSVSGEMSIFPSPDAGRAPFP